MNLVIDQGNTVCKVAVCSDNSVLKTYVLPRISCEDIADILDRHPKIDAVIYSTVAQENSALLTMLSKQLPFMLKLDASVPVPIPVEYDRSMLGSDRLAAAVGAISLCPSGVELLIIDAGTAVTYERVSSDGRYMGGNISPGLSLRMRSLNCFTERLPLVRVKGIEAQEYGKNTTEAIVSGVISGLIYEIDGYIDALRENYPEAIVVLAGGDSLLLQQKLKNKTYAVRNLVLYGLNRILEYNKV